MTLGLAASPDADFNRNRSPSAAGLFSGKVTPESTKVAGSRWDASVRPPFSFSSPLPFPTSLHLPPIAFPLAAPETQPTDTNPPFQTGLGVAYEQTYLKPGLLAAAKRISDAANAAGLDGHAVALRWTVYHSILTAADGDAVILGVSSLAQLQANLDAVATGPLERDLVDLVDEVWMAVQGEAAEYYT